MIILFFLINLVFCFLCLKFFYIIFREKIYYPFRLAEIYAYFISNFFLIIINFIFTNIFFTFLFIFTNSLIFYILYHLVNMIQTSPRTKILIDLLGYSKIKMNEYFKTYNIEIIVENRMHRFLSSNQIIVNEDKIFYNKKKSFFLNVISVVFFIIRKI